MITTWVAASIVAIVAGLVGFFVVLRGSSFLAHALPHGAFAGAAGAVLIGVDPILGMAVFAIGGALAVTTLGRRARTDVITALTLVTMLAFGALFLSLGNQYSAEVSALLFGQILGVSALQLVPIAVLGVASILAIVVVFRPLMFASITPDIAEARGVPLFGMSVVFALIVALATAMSVPIVGALLMFSLMVGPPAAARCFTARPGRSIALSIGIALVTVWLSIAISFTTDLPIGFFVTAFAAVAYGVGRAWVGLGPVLRRRHDPRNSLAIS